MNGSYFLIPTSNESNLTYLFIAHWNSRGEDKNRIYVVGKSRSILYSSKIAYLQIDWFTGWINGAVRYF